ncbi:hypothetical protein SMC26_06230 [Actinomadura fulvescens]|uniref:DivIVA domain-containing protein n=1 Tax=Actinomadura fulvescens TaxID=46160 RepID=A0ABN3PKU6_9ACTN
MTTPRLPRDDLAAALSARRELGPDYDDAFIDSVVDRIEQTLDARLAGQQRPAPGPSYAPAPPRATRGGGNGNGADLALAIVSLAAAIPLSAIAVVNEGMGALIIVWFSIVAINVAHALRPRRG